MNDRAEENLQLLEKCFAIMESERGKHFDPRALDAFFRRQSDIVRIQIDYACDVD